MKICVVEDNPDHQLIFKKRILEHWKDARVDSASDVSEAKKLLEKAVYDTILIDYRLKRSNGTDLVRFIRSSGIDTPAVMITSLEDVSAAVEAMKLGADDYICKSAESFSKLPYIIERVIREYQLKKQLREAEFRYKTIVEGMNEAVFLANLKGEILFVSNSIERLFGYRDEDFKKNFIKYLGEGDWERFSHNIRQAAKLKTVEPFALSMKKKDGQLLHIEINASPFRNNEGVTDVIGTIQDVTTRVLLEREIESEKGKIIDIFNSMADCIYVVDEDYRVKFINRALAKEVGEPRGKKCYELIYRLKNPCSFCKWKSIRKGYAVRWELKREDGKIFDIISSPLRNPDGSLYNMIILRDITRKKETEVKYRNMSEETLKSNRELKQTIKQLRQTQEQLIQSEKLAAIGKLVSGVAHELNNPLFSAMGYAELLFMDARYDGEQREKLENILESIKRARSIIKDLLRFARKETVEKELVNINDVIKKTLSLRQYELRVNNIDVECDLCEPMPAVLGNFVRLQQVLLNMLINAEQSIKEHKDSGIIRISSTVREAEQLIEVEVSDNGKPIPPENLGKIFDPFFTTKEVGKGTGLGLSTSYGIVKDHGGDISVQSGGEWTVFTVLLPFVYAKPETLEEEPQKEEELRVDGEKVLVVDDERIIVNLLEDFLKRKGYSVVKAFSGAEALDCLNENDVDLIITDIKMPEMDGKRFYSEIRSRKPELLERLIFITGDTLNSETRAFLRETKASHLKKPFSFDEITEVIKSVSKKLIQKRLFS